MGGAEGVPPPSPRPDWHRPIRVGQKAPPPASEPSGPQPAQPCLPLPASSPAPTPPTCSAAPVALPVCSPPTPHPFATHVPPAPPRRCPGLSTPAGPLPQAHSFPHPASISTVFEVSRVSAKSSSTPRPPACWDVGPQLQVSVPTPVNLALPRGFEPSKRPSRDLPQHPPRSPTKWISGTPRPQRLLCRPQILLRGP